jgi:hypothetical protein
MQKQLQSAEFCETADEDWKPVQHVTSAVGRAEKAARRQQQAGRILESAKNQCNKTGDENKDTKII